MDKIKVGILGATGLVGQRLISMLENHPWFEVAALTASERSSGKLYREAAEWRLPGSVPEYAANLPVRETKPDIDCRIVFSAVSSLDIGEIEENFARAGYIVVSNASGNRMAPDIPLIVPEVNPEHLQLIDIQKKNRGFKEGFIVTNPNCVAIPLSIALKPLSERFGIKNVNAVTLQALSGAGYPGVPSMELIDNVVPYISGEEEKIEAETKKLLGWYVHDGVVQHTCGVSAMVHRVPVRDGHMIAASIELEEKAGIDEIIDSLTNYPLATKIKDLPSTPARPVLLLSERGRPQPCLDRDAGGGMTVSIGGIRPCPVNDVRMNILGHNTIRGAAGAALLNAELLVAEGYVSDNSNKDQEKDKSIKRTVSEITL
ncbi:aspartate-semialdehyde dehydrogenase [candidate division KSB1 bacterium]